MKVLISKKTGDYYNYKGTGDYHNKEGTLKEADILSGKSPIVANTNREFHVSDYNFFDKFVNLKRGPQLITTKDLGYIAARTGLGVGSVVVEAGSGSGAATSFFCRIGCKVYTYEIEKAHYDIAKKNVDSLGFTDYIIENKDLALAIDEGIGVKADTLFLDMPDAEKIVEKDLSFVKSGGYIVCYLPSVSQIQELTKVIASIENTYYIEEISEIIHREWKVWDRVARPMHRKDIDHTAFLVFIRKI